MKTPKDHSTSLLLGLERRSLTTLGPLPPPLAIWLNSSTSTLPLGSASTPFSPTGPQLSSYRQLALPPTSASSSTLSLLAPTPKSWPWQTLLTPSAPRPPCVRLLPVALPATPKLLPDQFRGLPMLSPTLQAFAGLVDSLTSGPLTFVRGSDPFPPIPIRFRHGHLCSCWPTPAPSS
jgi:hypothetical protein